MKTYTIAVVRQIVTTVDAESYEEACAMYENEQQNGDADGEWHRAEMQFEHLYTEDIRS